MENQEEYLVDTDGETSALLAPQKNELSYLNPANLPNLDTAEVGFSLEATYKKFAVANEVFRAVFNGFTTIRKNENGEIKPMTAAVLQNKDGLFLNSTSNILDQLQRVPAGTAVQITYTGDQKTAAGYNVKKFDIRVLNVGGVKPAISAPKKDAVTAFWEYVNQNGIDNEVAQEIVKKNKGNFGQALLDLSAPF